MTDMKTLEIVNLGNQSYGVMTWNDDFYNELEPDLPEHLRQVWESCHVGDYTIFPSPFPIGELIDWCNERGIHVLIRSAIWNPKYAL